jgi:hypothetical protein
MSLVSVDSTTAQAHHDAAGMRVSEDVLAALEEAARQKGDRPGNSKGRTGTTAEKTTRNASSADASHDDGPA